MTKDSSVKYQYAVNLEDDVVNVNDLVNSAKTRREFYRCISCEQPVRPVLGDHRKKHFRHMVDAECNPETYLHQLAKKMFFQIYKDCLEIKRPFLIELPEQWFCTNCHDALGITCELEPKLIRFNLIDLFPQIAMETSVGMFIPDILLSNQKGDRLFIEFTVTHASTDEKRNSGQRMIELSLESENDLEMIQNQLISQTNPKAKFLNFKPITKYRNDFPSCNRKLYFFLLRKDGGAYILNDTPQQLKFRLERGDIVYSKVLPSGGSQIYFTELENSYYAKKKIRNCFLCRYHGENIYRDDHEGPIFCKFLKMKYISSQAVSCEFYRPDPKAFPTQRS